MNNTLKNCEYETYLIKDKYYKCEITKTYHQNKCIEFKKCLKRYWENIFNEVDKKTEVFKL